MSALTPDELNHLHDLAALLRAATPGLSFTDEDWPGRSNGLLRLPSGRIIGYLKPEYAKDGELFVASRTELAWLLRLVARLTEG